MATSSQAATEPKRGVLLFNLGGPEKLEDVRPFLYNLFSDPDIIRIKNDFLRKLLATFIAATRQRKSRDLYRQIGGGSPLRKITEEQAKSLEMKLAQQGCPARVYVGMRCWRPTIDAAVEQIVRDRVSQLIALPLFPQFSFTTTGSCFNYFQKIWDRIGLEGGREVLYIDKWFDEPLYIESIADLVQRAQNNFSNRDPRQIHLLYSAHSIPARYVTEGDPYQAQTEETMALVNARLGNASPSTLAYQSKVGPVKWLGPSTLEVLRRFGLQGVKQVLVIPISFVSDHIETLQEIDILYRDLAEQAGIQEFHRAASLNLYPKFVDALARLSLRTFRDFSALKTGPASYS